MRIQKHRSYLFLFGMFIENECNHFYLREPSKRNDYQAFFKNYLNFYFLKIFRQIITNFISHQIMRILRVLKSFLMKIDFFGSSEMLRYRGEGKYQTLTGGVVTFILVILFGVIALQRFTSVVNKDIVNSSDATYFLDDPTHTNFAIDDSKFIFGVGITNVDLNGPVRFFDVSFISTSYSNGIKMHQTLNELQPCEEEQWAKINDIGRKSYHKIGLNKYLCPKSNQFIEIGGKFTSQSFKIQKIKVTKCKNVSGSSRRCASEDELKSIPSFSLNFYFMNAYVNSDNLEPVNFYLEDRNYLPFTLNTTITSNIYLSEHFITTDSSLLPNQNSETETILLVKDLAEVKSIVATLDQYASIVLRKSSQYVQSTRSFEKFDQLFSYIGGLFGFAIIFFFLVNFYTEAAYEVQMGNRLFHYDSQNPLQPNKFNFLTYLGFCLFNAFKLVGLELPWDKMKQYSGCRQETSQQLDLALLMNKITFLQKSINVMLEEHQFRSIYLQQKPTIEQAESLRLHHGLNKFIHRKSTTFKSKTTEKVKSHKQGANTEANMNDLIQKETNIQKRQNDNEREDSLSIKQDDTSAFPEDMLPIIKAFVMRQINNESESGSSSIHPQSETVSNRNSVRGDERPAGKDKYFDEVPDSNIPSLRHINIVMSDIKRIKEESNQGNPISRRIYQKLTSQVSQEKLLILKCMENLGKKIIVKREKDEISRNQKKEARNFFKELSNNKKPQTQEIIDTGHQIALETNDRLEKSGFM